MTGITKAGRVYEGLDDPLHAYITGACAEDVQGAVKKIKDLVELHVYNPESEKVRLKRFDRRSNFQLKNVFNLKVEIVLKTTKIRNFACKYRPGRKTYKDRNTCC